MEPMAHPCFPPGPRAPAVRRRRRVFLCIVVLGACGAERTDSPEVHLARAERCMLQGDFERAARAYRKAARAGATDAQYELGRLYELGLGVPQDYARMFEWMREAARRGRPDAQYALGVVYAQSLKWGGPERRGAWWGLLDGHARRGGAGVERDDVRAVVWFRFAAAQGHSAAAQHLWLVWNRMPPADRARADALWAQVRDAGMQGQAVDLPGVGDLASPRSR